MGKVLAKEIHVYVCVELSNHQRISPCAKVLEVISAEPVVGGFMQVKLPDIRVSELVCMKRSPVINTAQMATVLRTCAITYHDGVVRHGTQCSNIADHNDLAVPISNTLSPRPIECEMGIVVRLILWHDETVFRATIKQPPPICIARRLVKRQSFYSARRLPELECRTQKSFPRRSPNGHEKVVGTKCRPCCVFSVCESIVTTHPNRTNPIKHLIGRYVRPHTSTTIVSQPL